MTYLYVDNYIAYTFSIIAFMLSTSLIHDVFKGHQTAIRQSDFIFRKYAFASI